MLKKNDDDANLTDDDDNMTSLCEAISTVATHDFYRIINIYKKNKYTMIPTNK